MPKRGREWRPWPVRKEHSDHMRERQRQNRARPTPPAEAWMWEKLQETGRKWTCQAAWGFRLFDFWCPALGIAVEVDGPEHDREKDIERDRRDFEVSGIIVLRVPNFDEQAAAKALRKVSDAETWQERREQMGLYRKGATREGGALFLARAALPEFDGRLEGRRVNRRFGGCRYHK